MPWRWANRLTTKRPMWRAFSGLTSLSAPNRMLAIRRSASVMPRPVSLISTRTPASSVCTAETRTGDPGGE
ncbi:hypothetical protein C1Y40_03584 [Mycobacterium talmoniae]|uniref:Uncharacterized protein n=1 Tax=Mycobacterium talmoniae TaxID=1858794 RepID=A0A2S8BHZ3_9MYCO|nr:hypothetical protein C1Y40_03584 [Mycobacterium talmoniae]